MKTLIVEDNTAQREHVERLLRERLPQAMPLASVGDGTQALARSRAERPELLVLDIQLPGLNGIEVARSQIEGLTTIVDDHDVRKAADDLDQKLLAVEQNLVDLRLTGPPGHTWESRLARKLSYLASQLSSADFKPTDQQLEVQKLLEERLASCQSQFDALRARDLLALNELLRQRNRPPITTTGAQ